MAETVADSSRSTLRWWIGALADGIGTLADRLSPPRRLSVRPGVDGGFDVADLRTAATVGRLDDGRTPEARGAILAAARGARIDIELHGRQIYESRLGPLPAAVAPIVDDVVRGNFERISPWRLGDCHFGARPHPDADRPDRIAVDVSIVPAALIDPLIAALSPAAPRRIDVVAREADGTIRPTGIAIAPWAARRRRRIIRAVAATLAGLATAAVLSTAAALWQESGRAARLADLETEAAALRADIAGRQAGAAGSGLAPPLAERAADLPAVVLWNRLADALPETSYLTDFELDGADLRIAGRSRDAAALIGRIEAAGGFDNVAFAAPTTRGEDGSDSFALAMTVARRAPAEGSAP